MLAGVPRHCTPFVLALRTLLQHADSIESAVAIMRSHLPRPTADIIIVGDGRANRAVTIETAGRELAVREMDDDAIWSANSFVTALAAEDRPGPAGAGVGETGNSQGRYTSYAELLGRVDAPLDVAGAVALLRDPYPRERHGYRYPAERARTICRPMTAFSLVMQPGLQRFWVGDLRLPAPLGRYVGFDLASEAPLPDATVPAERLSTRPRAIATSPMGDMRRRAQALERALVLDGESAPLRLMLAQVYRALGQEQAAQVQEERARAAGAREGQRIPFPSAIQPLVYLTLGSTSYEELRAMPFR